VSLVATASTVVLLAISPAVAGAEVETSMVGPTLGSGYVYWSTAKQPKGGARLPTIAVYQRRLADGRERLLLRSHSAQIGALSAEGDKVAFSILKDERSPSHKHRGISVNRIYAMTAEEPAPRLLAEARTFLIFKRRGTISSCGKTADLFDVSETGQVLVSSSDGSCPHGRRTNFGQIYYIDGSPPTRIHSFFDSIDASIQFGNLITNPSDELVITNLATGTDRHLKDYLLPDQVEMNEAGYLATVAESDEGADSTLMRVYPPGATKPSTEIAYDFEDFPSVVFCAGGLMELVHTDSNHLRLTLRGLDGTVLSRRIGPSAQYSDDASCEGRHLTVAVRKWNDKPTVFGFDL
jgi:hypothetical protein